MAKNAIATLEATRKKLIFAHLAFWAATILFRADPLMTRMGLAAVAS
jgi:hypothetical protein